MAKDPLPYPPQWQLLNGASGELAAIDWNEAGPWIERHGLGPAMHHILGERVDVPGPLKEMWAQEVNAAAIDTLGKQQALRDLLAVLAPSGIEPIVLKGAFIAFHLHDQLGKRPMIDLDLLFESPQQAADAYEILRAHGYQEIFEGDGDLRADDITSHQTPPLLAPGEQGLDLHWRLGHDPTGDLTGPAYRQRTIRRPLLGRDVTYPSLEDQAAHLIGHAVVQNNFNNGPVVFLDLAVLLAQPQFDKTIFRSRLEEHGMTRAAAPLLAVVGDLWPDLRPLTANLDHADLAEGVALMADLMETDRMDMHDGRSVAAIGGRDWLRSKLFPTKRERVAGGTDSLWGHWTRLLTKRLPRLVHPRARRVARIRQRFVDWADQ